MLELALGRSRRLVVAFLLAHATAGLAVGLADLPFAARGVLFVLVLASAFHALARHAWRSAPNAVIGVHLATDCTLTLHLRSGVKVSGERLAGTFVAPYLTLLGVRPPGRWYGVYALITPDAANGEAFRRLRVALRWKCSQAGD
jgi:toxin CptA